MKSIITAITNWGKYFYAVPFIIFGIFHFTGAQDMAKYFFGDCPVGVISVIVSGIALILAGLSIILNIKARLASLLLALLLLIIILSLHVPGMINAMNESAMQMSMTAMLKDLALMGAALTYAKMFE